MRVFDDVSNFMSSGTGTDRLKVLVPLDGSADAERALPMLSALSLLGDVKACLISVVDDRDLSFQPEVIANEERLRRLYLDQRLAALPAGVTSSEAIVCSGSPSTRIIEEAERVNADLVLVSSKKTAGPSRWVRGSVVDKVVRDCHRSALVIGRRDVPDQIKSVLLPLDGSSLAETAIPVARNFADLLGAALDVVRVVSPPAQPLDASRYSQGVPFNTSQMTAALSEIAEEYVARMASKLGARREEVLLGLPAEALTRYIEANAIDLVVMTPHGRTGPVRNALGSVTDRLLEGPASVLVVQTPLVC